jgi:light-regulated signal transduction histidine kinase (bacteriophytochrome)
VAWDYKRDSQGKVLGFLSVITDITERKQAQQAMARAAEDLKRSNEDLEQFAYVVSHDLQEPLRTVTGFLELFERRYGEHLCTDAREFIDYATGGASRMARMIDDLLEFSQLQSQARPLVATDCEAVLKEAEANLRLAIQESGAAVTHDPLPHVQADGSQLVQLFQNLISNSIKFCGQDPPRIHIKADGEADKHAFSVKDNGIGFDPQRSEHIFQVFRRLHSEHAYPGTGIGLALCKRVVERHGGRIWVDSEPGKGSTFHFTLPAARESAPT